MLLEYGIGRQSPDWHVTETKAPMYARVYSILGGRTVFHMNGMQRVLEPDWLYIFPIHAPYQMTTDPLDPIHCLYMHLDLRTANLSRLIAVPLQEETEIRHLVQAISDGVCSGLPAGYLEKLALAFGELCVLRGLFETLDETTAGYVNALREAYRTDVPLSRIAAQFGYTTEHFIRIFKKKMGVSPHQYIVSLRMSDAVRMLAGSAPLDEIGEAVGYSDGRSFSCAFRRYYGISPGVYRTQYAGYA